MFTTDLASVSALVHSTVPVEVKQRQEPDREAASDAPIVLFAVCFTMALATLILLLAINAWEGAREKTAVIQRLDHPCRNCQFFKDNPYVKCAVHPTMALTEQAIDCPDYQPLDHC